MYLDIDKDAFINHYMTTRAVSKTSLKSLFKKTELYEDTNNKDCSQFSQEEILSMYKNFEAKSADVLLNYNTILKAYSRWQKSNRYPNGSNAYECISQDMLVPLIPEKSTKLLTRSEIDEIENQLLNWTDRAIVECLWEGLSGDSMLDLVSITSDNLDTEHKLILLSGNRTFPLTDRLFDLLCYALDETEYQCYGECMRTKQLNGRGSLYKERDNVHALDSNDKYFRWVYRKIQIYRDYLDINRFTMKNISASGMCHYLKEGTLASGLDLKAFLKTEAGSEIMTKYGYTKENRIDNILHKFRQYFN